MPNPLTRAVELAQLLADLPAVTAIALGGSLASGAADLGSDIDLYVYAEREFLPDDLSAVIARAGGATRSDLSLPYWGGVNMWTDAATGIDVDCVYFGTAWMSEQITRVIDAHQPSLGYTTCFCRTVGQSQVLVDPGGWLTELQARCRQAYPEPLRRNIVDHNHPVLRMMMSSYLHQIESAVRRDDAVSVNHRIAGLLASYFDIVFALNRVLHPGEKRLLAYAHRECATLPVAMDDDIAAILVAAGSAPGDLVSRVHRLLDRLDALLIADGLLTTSL